MSLTNAISAFIQTGCNRCKMDVPAWAATYRCGQEDIRQEWERQMSEASLKPSNSYETPEGK